MFCASIAYHHVAAVIPSAVIWIGFEPDPHGILALAEDIRVADAGDARDLLLEMHVGVIGDEDLVDFLSGE